MKKYLFYLLVFYYLILNYLLPEDVERFSLFYFLLVVPVLAFITSFGRFILSKYTKDTFYLFVLFIMILLVSLVRFDIQTIASSFLLIFVIIAIINADLYIDLGIVNKLFLVSIVGSVVSTHLGINEYGYIPSLSKLQEITYGGPGPRISLFPSIPESSFFSLFIIIANYYLNGNRSRFVYYILGGYFFLLSGSRTCLLIFFFFLLFEILCHFFHFRNRLLFVSLNSIFIIAFIGLLSFKSMISILSETDNELIKALVFRNEVVTESSETKDISTRLWIWDQHFKIASQNPIFGIGTYKFDDYVELEEKAYQHGNGTESFLTSWFARVGISIILLLFFLVGMQKNALKTRNRFSYFLVFFFTVVIISYGSFIVPYNFMFLLLIVSLKAPLHEN